MNARQTRSASSPTGKVARILVALAAVVAVIFVIQHTVRQQRIAAEYNRIIAELVNQQKYAEGYDALVDLRQRVDESMAQRIAGDTALCAKALADDPGKSLAESAQWYRKAFEADPTSLNDRQKREMEVGEKMR